ncbi:MAG: helix-turn-helix transcriptional regulator [Sporichthyaceae bacterium]|nr:helix-turn-helix transcriptional regulator [Sporichthyaceae bacterium]
MATTSAREAREALGNRLRDIRRDARLTGRDLASLAGWHFTKVSKIEHGRTMPTESDLELWTFHCLAQSELPDLIMTARNVERMYAELRRLHRAGTARYQRGLLDDHAKARRFRVFTISLIPGVLQTRDYATVRLSEAAEMLGHPDDISETVEARMRRTELIRSGDRLFHFVVCENALRAGLAPPEVMYAQLRHLLEVQNLTRVHLGILPTSVRRYMPMCEFWIIDDRQVTTETFSAIITIDQPREIAVYAKVFDHYARHAIYGPVARDLITEAANDLEQLKATS